MRGLSVHRTLLLAALAGQLALPAAAQQVTVTAPYHRVTDGFYENTGVCWGLHGPGWFFRFGGAPLGPYGHLDPTAGMPLGYGFHRPGLGGYFYGRLSQGYHQSAVSWTPILTLTNGYPGYIADTSWSPFVISVVPIVGDGPELNESPSVPTAIKKAPAELPQAEMAPAEEAKGQTPEAQLAAAAESTAGRAAPSVEEARRLHAAEQAEREKEGADYLERARRAEAAGQRAVARQYYLMAYTRTTGPQREEIRARLLALAAPANPKK